MRTLVLAALSLAFADVAQAQWPTSDPNFHGAPLAHKPLANLFGEKGHVVISSDFRTDVEISSTKPPEGDSATSTTLFIAPALDYFVARDLAVGLRVGFLYSKSGGTGGPSRLSFEFGPHVGYAVPLSAKVSLFPKLGGAFRHISSKLPIASTLGGNQVQTGYEIGLDVSLPVLVHPFEHLFLGAGPSFSMDLVAQVEGENASKTTTFGFAFVIGGWF